MPRLSRLLAGLATISVVALAGCAAEEPSSSDQPIKLGLVTSLTGNFSTLGEGNLAGAQAAVAQLNADGGIDGRQVELVVKDDKTVADQSVVGFNDVAADSGVVAVIGSTDSTSATAVAPAAARSETVYLALSPVTALSSGENPWAFIVPSTTANYAKKLVDYWLAEGLQRIAVAYDSQDVFGESGLAATTELAAAAGIEIVVEEGFDPSATDFTATLTKVRNSGAEGLLVWAAGPAAVIITKQFSELGLEGGLFMSGAQASDLYLEPAGAAAEGVVLAAGVAVAGQELPEGELRTAIEALAEPYAAEHGGYPTEFFFNGAAGVLLLAEAIEQAGSTERAAIRDALAGLDTIAPTGHYRYSADDHGGLGDDAVVVLQVTDGAFVTTSFQQSLFETDPPR